MDPKPEIIRFGAREFTIRPLSLSQVRRIMPLTVKYADRAPTPIEAIDLAVDVIMIGMSRDYADIVLDDFDVTPASLQIAMNAVLCAGGFIASETASGEAPAPASTGAMSEAG